jgi:hypothetical protein
MYETSKLIRFERTLSQMHKNACRKLLLQLISMSVIVVVLDIGVLAVEFTGRYTWQTSIKGFAYSVKLKLEFQTLNQLVELVQCSSSSDLDLINEIHAQNPLRTQHEDRGALRSLYPDLQCWISHASEVQHEFGLSIDIARE